ncbi:MAG TPA: transaldolase family protein [Planctomycetota bacterium]|nr:transaldolase family protein [Planctomycetota bacterium]
MKIFIDSADLDQIREAYAWGIVDGVTTNPSLIKKAVEKLKAGGARASIEDYIKRVLEAAAGTPVSLEVIGVTEEDMTRQGFFLYKTFNPVADNVVVKVPVNPACEPGSTRRYDGLKTIKTLASEGIPINTTLVFTPEQAFLAAKAGAAYVSPFAGRVDDELRKKSGHPGDRNSYFPAEGARKGDAPAPVDDNGVVSGVGLVDDIVQLFGVQDLDCEVLAASLRTPRQVRECALVGADAATIPFEVIRDMVDHYKTVEGMNAFVKDVVPEYADLFRKA